MFSKNVFNKIAIIIMVFLISTVLIININASDSLSPNDPSYYLQKYLLPSTDTEEVKLTQTSDYQQYTLNYPEIKSHMDGVVDGDDVIVAILDVGFDYLHYDLYTYDYFGPFKARLRTGASLAINEEEHVMYKGKNAGIINLINWLVSTFWGIEDGVPYWGPWSYKSGMDGKDNDGNGYVDDIVGWDFVDNDNDPYIGIFSSHGTKIGGVIGAVGNNKLGVVGLTSNWGNEDSWSVKILPLRVNNDIIGTDPSVAAKAIRYAVDRGAKVISNSWGYGLLHYRISDLNRELKVDEETGKMLLDGNGKPIPREPYPEGSRLVDAIEYARQNGVIFVWAAGNKNYDLDNINYNDPEIKIMQLINLYGFDCLDNPESYNDVCAGVKDEFINAGADYEAFKLAYGEKFKYGNPDFRNIIGEDDTVYPNENGFNSWQEYGKLDSFYEAGLFEWFDNIIVVSSTDYYGKKRDDSNYGKNVSCLFAPGTGVQTIDAMQKYGKGSCTSIATPHVASAAALIMAAYPELSYLEVKQAIMMSVDKDDDLTDLVISGGRLNIVRALELAEQMANPQ